MESLSCLDLRTRFCSWTVPISDSFMRILLKSERHPVSKNLKENEAFTIRRKKTQRLTRWQRSKSTKATNNARRQRTNVNTDSVVCTWSEKETTILVTACRQNPQGTTHSLPPHSQSACGIERKSHGRNVTKTNAERANNVLRNSTTKMSP